MAELEQLKSTLKARNFSLTIPRKTVFLALLGSDPLTMHKLIMACPAINRASAYRTVILFERLGIIQRLQIGWKYKLELSDSFQQHHHHLTCIICGRVTGLAADSILEHRLNHLSTAYGFKMSGHQLEIQGLCNNCRGATA